MEFENKIRKVVLDTTNQVNICIAAIKDDFNSLKNEMAPYKDKFTETFAYINEVKTQLSHTNSMKDLVKKMVFIS